MTLFLGMRPDWSANIYFALARLECKIYFAFISFRATGTGLLEWESFTQSQVQGIAQSKLLTIRNLDRFE